ncbi:MAG: methionyl-tRNA formyltransferase [Candidatus Aminicenantes bacterium]|nr:methionyl-tRNA formyltransferase [Candidatus Aminicenantes bacterium]
MANGDLVFFGTAAVGLPIARELNRDFRLRLVVTQPDRRGGRHRRWIATPIKQFALENRLPLLQPPNLKEPELELALRRIDPDIAVVVAYGQFIPRDIRDLPRHRSVNVHFSLLPAYRGAAPVQRAIQNGERSSGLTIFELSGRMDAGPVWAREEIAIRPDDTSASYQQRLAERAAPFLSRTLEQIFSGQARPQPQDDSQATLAPPLKKEEGRANWELPARRLFDCLRAFTPWPGLFFIMDGRQVRILEAGISQKEHALRPGEILALSPQGLQVACGLGTVMEITLIQPEGRKAMSPWQFSLGNRFAERLT